MLDLKHPEPAAPLFQKVVDTYPNSVFAPKCFRLARLYQHMTERRAGRYTEEQWTSVKSGLLRSYPNSGNAGSWLLAMMYEFADNRPVELSDERRIALCDEMMSAFRGTRCFRFASQMKRWVQKGEWF